MISNLHTIMWTVIVIIVLLVIIAYWYAILVIAAITVAFFTVKSIKWLGGVINDEQNNRTET